MIGECLSGSVQIGSEKQDILMRPWEPNWQNCVWPTNGLSSGSRKSQVTIRVISGNSREVRRALPSALCQTYHRLFHWALLNWSKEQRHDSNRIPAKKTIRRCRFSETPFNSSNSEQNPLCLVTKGRRVCRKYAIGWETGIGFAYYSDAIM